MIRLPIQPSEGTRGFLDGLNTRHGIFEIPPADRDESRPAETADPDLWNVWRNRLMRLLGRRPNALRPLE